MMEGKIIKMDDMLGVIDNESGDFLCLHPDDVNDLLDAGLSFDELDVEHSSNPKVNFKKVAHIKFTGISYYAKIKKTI